MSDYNAGHLIEATDRVHTVSIMVNDLLSEHPAITHHSLSDDVEEIQNKLFDLYQKIGTIDA